VLCESFESIGILVNQDLKGRFEGLSIGVLFLFALRLICYFPHEVACTLNQHCLRFPCIGAALAWDPSHISNSVRDTFFNCNDMDNSHSLSFLVATIFLLFPGVDTQKTHVLIATAGC
jgi:hypothetical protein